MGFTVIDRESVFVYFRCRDRILETGRSMNSRSLLFTVSEVGGSR